MLTTKSSSELFTFYGQCLCMPVLSFSDCGCFALGPTSTQSLTANRPARTRKVRTAIRRTTHKCQVSERKIGAAQQVHSCVQVWIKRLRKMIPRMATTMRRTSQSQLRDRICPLRQALPRFSGVGTESGSSFKDNITGSVRGTLAT